MTKPSAFVIRIAKSDDTKEGIEDEKGTCVRNQIIVTMMSCSQVDHGLWRIVENCDNDELQSIE